MTKKRIWREKKQEKSNGEQSDLCDIEQVTLKPQLQAHHCLTTWLQIWYHCLIWGDSKRKGADIEKADLLIRRPPRGNGEINCSYYFYSRLLLLAGYPCLLRFLDKLLGYSWIFLTICFLKKLFLCVLPVKT